MGAYIYSANKYPDSKVHGANMGPTWVLSAPDGPHVGLTNLAIKVVILQKIQSTCRELGAFYEFTTATDTQNN